MESVAGCSWNRWPDGRGIRILEQIEKLDFPQLCTELTGAYRIATEMYELDPQGPQECDYFDSLMDFAPKSHAAREIRRLTEELINRRI
ncbi:hypothetical protein RS3R2_42800 [Pseudomonas lactis]|nr:hypothetical protein RS3R2_42800 [Pseudomonas lactis]